MKNKLSMTANAFASRSFEEICRLAHEIGYDCIEVANYDLIRGAEDPSYYEPMLEAMARHQVTPSAVAVHMSGKMVAQKYDPHYDVIVPEAYRGKPLEIQAWAKDQMLHAPTAIRNLGADLGVGFMGSVLWDQWYMWPPVSQEEVDAGFDYVKEQWTPILDEFDRKGVLYSLEIHPTETAYDIYTCEKLLAVFQNRKTLGFTLDTAHLYWQGIEPFMVVRRLRDKIYNIHLKDCYVERDGISGILGSHFQQGDPRRGFGFRLPGRGMIDFEKLFRELTYVDYARPIAVEWEDFSMDTEQFMRQGYAFAEKLRMEPFHGL